MMIVDEADHLRPGERPHIIAINRGTQYLGDDARDPTDDSQKAAPVIGFEGAGLGTDTAIVVYTEWLAQDGRALPEALGDYGYTARFAKIVAPNQLDDAAVGQADDGSGAVAQFPIKPGKHTSVIRFSNPNSNREHLYIHVSGQPFTRQADFEQLQVFQMLTLLETNLNWLRGYMVIIG